MILIVDAGLYGAADLIPANGRKPRYRTLASEIPAFAESPPRAGRPVA